MFPGINFALLDSDCLPFTLFEVEDLWTEAYLARYPAHSESGILKTHPLRAFERFRTDPRVVYTQDRVCSTRMGQGALVVPEPRSELNAGLIVIFRSSHPPLFDWHAWSLRFRSSPGSVTDEESRTKPPIWLLPSGTELVSFLCVRALPVSLALRRRRSGFNLVWRFRL